MTKIKIGFGAAAFTLAIAIPTVAHAEKCSDGSNHAPSAPQTLQAQQVQGAIGPQRNERTLPAEECVDRDIFLMPGVQTVYFHPTAGRGSFYGGGVQFAPYQMSHNNDHFGPSQFTTLAQVSLLQSPNTSGTMALFELGATASLERNASRRYLIPYFGGTVGGLTQSELGTSSYVYTMGGMHLYWHHNLMVDAEGGYHFPFQDIDHLKGPRAQISARFSLW